MSELKFRAMSMSEAKRWANELDHYSDDEFALLTASWRNHEVDIPDSSYADMREIVLDAFDRLNGGDLPSRKMYPVDVEVGLDLYAYLSAHDFSVVEASDDDVWRFLTIKIFPDITYARYPDPEKEARERGGRINRKRFFSHTRRIWLKTLWWYVHLSWQGTKEATWEAIEENGSNIISHFIETPGKGYRVELYRAIMKRYSARGDKSDHLFRSIAKLNGAECRNIEPDLLPGGATEYCDLLFGKIDESRL